jgi:cystathionine beta-lyase
MTDGTLERGFRTTLFRVGRASKREHGVVNPPLLRGSTVLVPTVGERQALGARRGERALTYGTGGSATHCALEDAIAAIEGGTRSYIVGTGLAAVTTPLLGWLKAGDHMLMPNHVYGPARNFASGMLAGLGADDVLPTGNR